MRNARHRVSRQTKPNQRIAGHTKSRVPLFSFSEQNMLIQSVLICLRKALGGFTEVLLGHTFMSSIKNENKQVENLSINFNKKKSLEAKIAFKFTLFVSCEMSYCQNFQR